MSHLGIAFIITKSVTFEGHTLWGFRVSSLDRQQRPCWYTKKEAIQSANFHINQWLAA